MKRQSGPSKAFTIFAITMASALVIGTVIVFGGSFFGFDDGPQDGPETVQEEVSRLETAVAADPNDGNSAAILASIYENQGNISAAIPLYEQATANLPIDGNLRLTFGIALLRNGSFLDARVQLERALDLMPESAGPAYYLGQLEQIKPEPDEEAARAWYERAIEAAPDSFLADEAQTRIDEIDGVAPTATPGP